MFGGILLHHAEQLLQILWVESQGVGMVLSMQESQHYVALILRYMPLIEMLPATQIDDTRIAAVR